MKKKAFAIAAHPDDIEFMMSGTLLLLKDAGYEIHYMAVGNGALGSNRTDRRTTASIRRSEAMASCESVGAFYHESLCDDLDILYTNELLSKLVPIIREVSPEIVLTHGSYDYMEDHINAGRLAVSAAFCRGMKNFKCTKSEIFSDDTAVYHSMPQSLCDQLGRPIFPEFYVNVESKTADKRKMLLCHKSQEEWLDETQKFSFVEAMDESLLYYGNLSGKYKYAEGWIRHDHRGFSPKNFNPLCLVLKDYIVANDNYGRL